MCPGENADGSTDEPDFRKRVEKALEAGMPIPDFPDASPLEGLAMAQHECYISFKKAGFSHGAAMYLTAAMFSGNPGQLNTPDNDG